jgi:hypothetical protein
MKTITSLWSASNRIRLRAALRSAPQFPETAPLARQLPRLSILLSP